MTCCRTLLNSQFGKKEEKIRNALVTLRIACSSRLGPLDENGATYGDGFICNSVFALLK